GRERVHQRAFVEAEEYSVYRVEGQALVVDVDDFSEGVARRVLHEPPLSRALSFDLLPNGLGGRQGVVAVPHGEEQGIFGAVPSLEGSGIGPSPERVGQSAEEGRILYLPAPDGPRAEHELEVVELGKSRARGVYGLDRPAPRIVQEEHDVGKLDGRSAADAHSRGKTLDDRAFAGADEGGGVGPEAVGFEVHGE